MISTVNFHNHINQFIDSIRGSQRILFVGTGVNIEDYPEIANLRWRCIYTTNQAENFADAFSKDDRQVCSVYTKNEYDKLDTKMNWNNPPLIFLNGRPVAEGEENDIFAGLERDDNRDYLLESMAYLLKSSTMVELVVIGYDPENDSELPLKEFLKKLYSLSDKSVTFYGIGEDSVAYEGVKALCDKGVATLFEQNAAEFEKELKKQIRRDASSNEDELEDVSYTADELRHTVYIEGKPVLLRSDSYYEFSKFGKILTVHEMNTGNIGSMMRTEYFYRFLKLSPNVPQWYGYSKRNSFSVKREFVEALYKKVQEGLENNIDNPIALVGQSGSGKSVSLAALAYRVFHERKYPVIFINNSGIASSDKTQFLISLNNLLGEIRNNGGHALVILDWSLYNLQRNDIVENIANTLKNKGQNVLVLVSAMSKPNGKTYVTVDAPIELSDKEKKDFKNLMIDNGGLPRDKVEKWMERNKNENGLLSMLYRLLYELHPQLELGIKTEINSAIKDIELGINELDDPIIKAQPINPLAEKLFRLGWIDSINNMDLSPEEKKKEAKEKKQNIVDNLNIFCKGLAVASLFKIRMPETMALRLLRIPECKNKKQYIKTVLNAPWIHYAEDDDMYSPGVYYVSFRDPTDARIYLNSIKKTDGAVLEIVASLIDTMLEAVKDIGNGKTSFFNDEVKFLERLIKMVGPNSDDITVSENWHKQQYKYVENSGAVIAALANLRKNGITELSLVVQEITYIRENYGDYSRTLADRERSLEEAIRIARDVIDRAERRDDTLGWQLGLIDSIKVESIFAQLRLEECRKQMQEYGITPGKNDPQIIQTYDERSRLLFDIINNHPENSYAYTALMSCYMSEYADMENTPLTPQDKQNMISRTSPIMALIDVVDTSIPQVEENTYYQDKKFEFLRKFDQTFGSDSSEEYFKELLKMESAVGIHLKARAILRKYDINYKNGLYSDDAKAACEEALALLDGYAGVVSRDAACQYMRLNLKWLCYNGKPLFEKENQCTRLSEEQWEELCEICEGFRDNIFKGQDGLAYRARVYYILALAYAQLGRYEEASKTVNAVNENDIYTAIRQKTWHILCDGNGNPKVFNGTFNYSSPHKDREIYIREMRKWVHYPHLNRINKSAESGDAPNLCIGTSYRDFSAFIYRDGGGHNAL